MAIIWQSYDQTQSQHGCTLAPDVAELPHGERRDRELCVSASLLSKILYHMLTTLAVAQHDFATRIEVYNRAGIGCEQLLLITSAHAL